MKLFNHIPAWIRSKYFIAVAVFAGIMLFFDKNDVFTQAARSRQLRELEQSKQYFTERIASERKDLEQLKSNHGALEKFAREKYLMKKEEEDLFLVPEKPVSGQN